MGSQLPPETPHRSSSQATTHHYTSSVLPTPTAEFNMEYGIEYDSCALLTQSKRKNQLSLVLRSCIGACAWMIRSWGKQRDEESEREGEEKREKRDAQG